MDPPPPLTAAPTAFSGCCLGLSRPLLDYISTLLLPRPSLALSIGSGYGLLEAYLATEPYNVYMVGVEVAPTSNLYLPAHMHRVVHGSRFLEPLAANATTWLFVYPRRAGLVQEYLDEHGDKSVQRVIWAGPKADWDDYKGCFVDGWKVDIHSADEVGGRAWELIAVVNKTCT
ncbi:hypothetical protein T440DRAFT_472677 [Plenodomus tracheiphilus IPT5]|uniref:Uncharacterized protein n=1 Tax=Plenodomus tracheiphilus IPT5 TaxID=1408161 RepID=A0A6A7AQK6_9PLEO|nr:hypothetical protein T440DRAFT_472677 [Plenodomus tracheiphilus IPT5]